MIQLKSKLSKEERKRFNDRLFIANSFLNDIMNTIGTLNVDVSRLIKDAYKDIMIVLVRNPKADYSYIIDNLIAQLKQKVYWCCDYALSVAREREKDEDTTIPSFLPNFKSIFSETIDKYSNILEQEIEFFKEKEYSKQQLPLYLNDPLAYISTYKNDIADFKNNVDGGQGLSYSLSNNMIKLLHYSSIIVYNHSLLGIWQRKGVYGYYGVRGSNYPCDLCDSEAYIVRNITDMIYPLHPNCVCKIIPIMLDDIINSI